MSHTFEQSYPSNMYSKINFFYMILGCLSLLTCMPAWTGEVPIAVVNGAGIPRSLMERSVRASISQGSNDTPALRNSIRDELIARELMAQESVRRGLDKRQESKDIFLTLRQNLLIELLLQDEIEKHPITEEEVELEYNKQIELMKSSGEREQYHLSIIALGSEHDAREALAGLHAGQDFELLARMKSKDPSKDRDGDLGWLLLEQITPIVGNVVANLAVNSVSMVPIQVGPYWHVVKLLGKRNYKTPNFDESKDKIKTMIMQNRRSSLLKNLQYAARISY